MTLTKSINIAANTFKKCADNHCSSIITTDNLLKLVFNKTKRKEYIKIFKKRMQCIDKHCMDEKKKFNTVIPIPKTKNSNTISKIKKSKKLNRIQKQRAGAGQITDTNLIAKILAKVNSDTVLIGNITTALQQKEKPSVAALQRAYTSVANSTRLFDLIYAGQALTKYDTATQPSLIWDHGINNPESITAGKPGTHIYIYEDNTTGLFKLLGVIYKL